jgi:ribonucleotide monophosphatase NagD (HAD superfamily)
VNCPVEDGFIPDIGAIMAFIEATTNRRPDIIIGKPYMPILSATEIKSGFQIKDMAIVGDRLYTDMALSNYGVKTILVLTGETSLEDFKLSGVHPGLVVNDLNDLIKYLK